MEIEKRKLSGPRPPPCPFKLSGSDLGWWWDGVMGHAALKPEGPSPRNG